MERSLSVAALLALTTLNASAQGTVEDGHEVYAKYCASCHGPEGAGLIGPNLTDAEVLHGESLAEIKTVVAAGVPAKAMPPWEGILSTEEIASVSLYVQSIMGNNLEGPAKRRESTVNAFPTGTEDRPYLIRTFMPTLGIDPEIFANHGNGQPTPKYSPRSGTFDPEQEDHPIDGIPSAIAVNFGPSLSYCFDTTECRLLYTWSGGFLDMTDYWGEGEGGSRKRFAYLPKVIGEIGYKAQGDPLLTGKPEFKAYEKRRGIPAFLYSVGEIDIDLHIVPGDSAGVAVCELKLSGNIPESIELTLPQSSNVTIASSKGSLSANTLRLTKEEAASFSLTYTPTAQ